MKIFDENTLVNMNYSLEQLKEISKKQEIVFATIKGVYVNHEILLNLGKDINAKMYLEDFDYNRTNYIDVKHRIGKNIMAIIKEVDDYGNVLLSRVDLQKRYKEDVLDKIKPGTVIDTKVLSLTSFGAFVDMGIGFVALLPIGDISIARFEDIHEVLQIGQEISVIFKGISSKGYVVSHRELLGTWEENVSKLKIGNIYVGKIRDITNYGAFIELFPNLTGLADLPKNLDIHIGDSVNVLYKSCNPNRLKVKLHINGFSEEPYSVKYEYKDVGSNMFIWMYTPSTSRKKISTVFK